MFEKAEKSPECRCTTFDKNFQVEYLFGVCYIITVYYMIRMLIKRVDRL